MSFLIAIAGIAFVIWLITSNTRGNPLLPTEKPERNNAVGTQNKQTPPQQRHMRDAILFAKGKHSELLAKQKKQLDWEQKYGKAKVAELDNLDGVAFEEFLEGMFQELGYSVEKTRASGDFGADLILTKATKKIAVQAKRYTGSVGVSAIQEALSGMSYYNCNAAWVVTTGQFTKNAKELAEKSSVRIFNRDDIAKALGRLVVPSQDKARS